MKILLPLRVLENRVLAVVITLDLVIILSFIIMKRVEQFPVFTKILGSCRLRNTSINISNWSRLQIANGSYLVLPLILTLCCCVLCSLRLAKSTAGRTFRQRRLSCKKTRSMISILAFSMIGLVLNFLSFGAVHIRQTHYQDSAEWIEKEMGKFKSWFLIYGYILFNEITITSNSIINPMIFIWRMKDFRTHISSTVFNPAFTHGAQCLVHILNCAPRIFRTSNSQQSEIELQEMGPRGTDNQINLQNSSRRNLQNSSDIIQGHPENEDPVQEIDAISPNLYGLNLNLKELSELKTRIFFFLELDHGKYCP